MGLADSSRAIGAVSSLLRTRLMMSTSASAVNIGRPDTVSGTGSKFNLFLYQVEVDSYLQNYVLDEGQKPPLWLTLSYLLTAFDDANNSDNELAHNLLGEGMLALQEMNYIESMNVALKDNPETLKVSLDSANSDLLSKIMQGSDEKYRVSVAFQIRPIMIAPSDAPAYTLPVESIGPPENPGVEVYPTPGPFIESLRPDRFATGDVITLSGRDIGNSTEQIIMGDQRLPVIAANTGFIKVRIPDDVSLSAGSHIIRAVMTLEGDQELTSNAALGHFLPTLDSASSSGMSSAAGLAWGTLDLNGHYLGNDQDDIYVSFYRNGEVVLMQQVTGSDQTTLSLSIVEDDAIAVADYHIILRINGEQALNTPVVSWS